MLDLQPSDRRYGDIVVLGGADGGKYPDGNAFLIEGADTRLLVDPSLTVHRRGAAGLPVDGVLLSHVHEDHVPGLAHYRETPVAVHTLDRPAIVSIDGLMDAYGYEGELRASWRQEVLDEFHFVDRPDAVGFEDGHVWDLGGGRTVTAVFLPGHTAGHCGFLVEPDGFFYIADIDLTGFGPYYGDASSTLEGFEWSLQRCREIDARWYATFHHKGVVEGREPFLEALSTFGDAIARRDEAMLAFLAEPRSLEDLVAHRFVYRPNVTTVFADAVERRSAELHLARLVPAGRVVEVEPGRFLRAA